jgi:putative ABC transport system ATP-binding protein
MSTKRRRQKEREDDNEGSSSSEHSHGVADELVHEENMKNLMSEKEGRRALRAHTSKELGEPVVRVSHLTKEYTIAGREDTVHALNDIHLAENGAFAPVRQGEFVMLRGPSGGGKTTFLNMLGTIDRATSGEVDLLGTRIDTSTSDAFLARLRLEKIGFVFQTFNLLAAMSAFENVELPMAILGKLSHKERKQRTKDLLKSVGLQDRMGHLPSELSGGEQQRVTIARALANKPKLLLLDEPTGDLDTKNTVEVMDLLLEINQTQNATMVMVTHNPDVECYADRILYLSDGKFERQAVNSEQSRLNYQHYVQWLNKVERGEEEAVMRE